MHKRFRRIATLAVVAMVASGAGAALAIEFSDVPPSHPFADEIYAMADAGITNGYLDGTFRPNNNVTRQAMAAFLGRGFGRVTEVYAENSVAIVEGANVLEGSAFMTAGATGSGGGYVYVSGWATVETSDPSDCPCEVQAYVIEDGGATSVDGWFGYGNIPGVATESGYASVTVPFSAVYPIAADVTHEYLIGVDLWDVDADLVEAYGTIEAVYVPFDGTGAGLGEPVLDVGSDVGPRGRR